MTQSTKIAPVDETENSPSENLPATKSTSKIKYQILVACIIFISVTCVALVITLPIVLKDSTIDSDFETTSSVTSIPVSPTPISGNAVLVLGPEGTIPFVVNFKGKIHYQIFLRIIIYLK